RSWRGSRCTPARRTRRNNPRPFATCGNPYRSHVCFGFEFRGSGNPMPTMPIGPVGPDLAISLRLDAYAPRAARFYVAQVDRPSPDLRDAVVLLTSELVSRAVEQCGSAPDEEVELRAWMPADVVRVELRAPRDLLDLP